MWMRGVDEGEEGGGLKNLGISFSLRDARFLKKIYKTTFTDDAQVPSVFLIFLHETLI